MHTSDFNISVIRISIIVIVNEQHKGNIWALWAGDILTQSMKEPS